MFGITVVFDISPPLKLLVHPFIQYLGILYLIPIIPHILTKYTNNTVTEVVQFEGVVIVLRKGKLSLGMNDTEKYNLIVSVYCRS